MCTVMRLLPVVLLFVAGLNVMYGVPAVLGLEGLVRRGLPGRSEEVLSALQVQVRTRRLLLWHLSLSFFPCFTCVFCVCVWQVHGVAFGALALLLGSARGALAVALLRRERAERELFVLGALSFALEMARDAQMGLLLDHGSADAASISIAAALLLWMALVAKHYTK